MASSTIPSRSCHREPRQCPCVSRPTERWPGNLSTAHRNLPSGVNTSLRRQPYLVGSREIRSRRPSAICGAHEGSSPGGANTGSLLEGDGQRQKCRRPESRDKTKGQSEISAPFSAHPALVAASPDQR